MQHATFRVGVAQELLLTIISVYVACSDDDLLTQLALMKRGVIESVIAAMQKHPANAGVQEQVPSVTEAIICSS